MFRRVLIANRGEIARRIIRACEGLGIESVAIHSEPDTDLPFVREASQALCIGPARARESYLDMQAILQAALQSQSQAIHPGYGFLAENALFAQMVQQAGLTWIGPSPALIRKMGQKSPAKEAIQAAGLPVIPGSQGLLSSLDEAEQLAEELGYPVLIKADAGGGGRGMRRANSPAELRTAWDEARAEAAAAFGSDAMYLEKFLDEARHIEFQILADSWGNAVHLFERECSIQRRHQKLLEEAPSPALSQGVREAMGERVAKAVAAIGYVGAGTIEFLQDPRTGALYFIEMNTRLQVEHPVTEEITGVDIVQAQIRIAAGERLWFQQSDVKIHGHAIEVRINAEDPDAGFKPVPGVVRCFRHPPRELGVARIRVDAAVDQGSRISPYYDSMVAKLICWAPDRLKAIYACQSALKQMQIVGVPTTASLQAQILATDEFKGGDLRVGRIPGRPDLSEGKFAGALAKRDARPPEREDPTRTQSDQPSEALLDSSVYEVLPVDHASLASDEER